MKLESGVMVMKGGKAWGCAYKDGQVTVYGWVNPEDALIYDPMYCKKPTDVTYKGSFHIKELRGADLVYVRRRTSVHYLKKRKAMKYHKQQIMHDPENGQFGDCYRTAIACLLDLELEDVPHFGEGGPDGEEFDNRVDKFLYSHGLTRFSLGYRTKPQEFMNYIDWQNPNLTYMISGKTPRCDASHGVIAKGNKILHDPHPDELGLDGPDSDGGSWVELLLPINIHRSE